MDPREAFERWKYFHRAGRADAHCMMVVATWLLSLGTAVFVYITIECIDFGPTRLQSPQESAVLSLLGVALSLAAVLCVRGLSDIAARNWRIGGFYEEKAALSDAFGGVGEVHDPSKSRLARLFQLFLAGSSLYLLAFVLSLAWALRSLLGPG